MFQIAGVGQAVGPNEKWNGSPMRAAGETTGTREV